MLVHRLELPQQFGGVARLLSGWRIGLCRNSEPRLVAVSRISTSG
jgi:hypothetical protein